MALFGLGYGISKAAGMMAGLLGKDESTRKGVEATAALLTMGIDPVGSVAALSMLGIKAGAKSGSGVCKAIVVGTTVFGAAEAVTSSASIGDSISEG